MLTFAAMVGLWITRNPPGGWGWYVPTDTILIAAVNLIYLPKWAVGLACCPTQTT